MEALSKLGEIGRLWGDIKERGTVGQRAQRGFCPWGVKASQRAVEPGDLARDNGGAYRTSGRAAGGGEGGGVGVGPALGGGCSLLGSEAEGAREQTLLGCCITPRTPRDKRRLLWRMAVSSRG